MKKYYVKMKTDTYDNRTSYYVDTLHIGSVYLDEDCWKYEYHDDDTYLDSDKSYSSKLS